MKDNCVFCKIDNEKTRVIDESKNTITILSNPALVKAHCLVIPKRHIEKISELTKEEIVEIFDKMIRVQEKLLRKFSGCDIRQNYSPFMFQGKLKVNHLHFHLQPREFEDELYKKSQIYEKDIFKDLNQDNLDEVKNFILN